MFYIDTNKKKLKIKNLTQRPKNILLDFKVYKSNIYEKIIFKYKNFLNIAKFY